MPLFSRHPAKLLNCMAGTSGFEPLTLYRVKLRFPTQFQHFKDTITLNAKGKVSVEQYLTGI